MLKEHERQQAMLVDLRRRLRARVASNAEAAAAENSRSRAAPAHQCPAPETKKDESPAVRGRPNVDQLYALKPKASRMTDQQLLEDLRAAASALRKSTITLVEYKRQRRWGSKTFLKRFGSWNGALAAAGLPLVVRKNIPTQALFENLARVWQAVGRQPVEPDMVRPLAEYSSNPYRARFGGWRNALEAFVAWTKEGKSLEESAPAPACSAPENARAPSFRLRFAVLQRDSFKCAACGRSPVTDAGVKLHVDHKIPWSRGGRTTLDNLTTLCEKCNLGKADTTTS